MKKSHMGTILLACLLAGVLASCGDSGKQPAETSGKETESKGTEVPETETVDPLIDPTVPTLDKIFDEELDFGGKEFRFLGEQLRPEQMNGDAAGDIVDAAVYQRNLNVSEALNVTFAEAATVEATKLTEEMQRIVTSGLDEFETVVCQRWCSSTVAPLGYLMDASELEYLNLENPWWAHDFIEEMTYGGVYWLTSDMMTNYTGGCYAVFANSRIWNELDYEDLYGIVKSGKWTIDLMRQYVRDAYRDLNNDGVTDDGDRLGFAGGYTEEFVSGMGVDYCTKDDSGRPALTMWNDRSAQVWEKLYEFYVNSPGIHLSGNSGTIYCDLFVNGNVLFMDDMLSYASNLRNMEDDFYIVPTPKFDEEQKNYISLNAGNGAQFGIPTTCREYEMAGAVLEALSAESQRIVRNAYYDLTLGEKLARDADSREMIDLISATAHTDFGYCYARPIASGMVGNSGVIFDFFRQIGFSKYNDPASLYEHTQKKYNRNLNELLEAFEDIR